MPRYIDLWPSLQELTDSGVDLREIGFLHAVEFGGEAMLGVVS
jgi:hypothetical protein